MKYQKINTKIKLNKIPIKTDTRKVKDINKIKVETQKHLKNSPRIKKEEEKEKSMVYQKPKLIENSVKREKKKIILINRPMTTKRPAKKYNLDNINNNIEKPIYSIRNRNIYKSGYTLLNREKKLKNIPMPVETSPNRHEQDIHNNVIRKKNYSKKLLDEIRPQNMTSNIANNYLLGINRTEINLNLDEDVKKRMNNNEKNNNKNIYINNRENMINILKNENNKKNNEIKNEKKYAYKKIPLREKKIINKKNDLERKMTEPELLLNSKKLNEKEKMNLSLNEQGKKDKLKKIGRYNIKYNKENINKKENQSNSLICNNYVTINNTLVSNYPVKFVDVFHQ